MKVFIFVIVVFIAGCSDSPDEPVEESSIDQEFRTLAVLDTIGIELGDSTYMFGAIEGLFTFRRSHQNHRSQGECPRRISETSGNGSSGK